MTALQSYDSFLDLDSNQRKVDYVIGSPLEIASPKLDRAFIPSLRLQNKAGQEQKLDTPKILNKEHVKSSNYVRTEQIDQLSSYGRSDKKIKSFTISKNYRSERLTDRLRKTQTLKHAIQSIRKYPNFIRRFTYLLKQFSNQLNIKDLTNHENYIVKSLLDSKLSQKDSNGLVKYLNYLPLWDNQSRFIRIFDITQVIFVVIAIFWYPLEFSFDVSEIFIQGYFDQILIFLFTQDIIMRLSRSQLHQGQVIKKRVTIFQRYMKQEFVQDVLSKFCIFLKLFIANKMIQAVLIIVFILYRLSKVVRIIDDLNDHYNFSQQVRDILSLINMILTVIFIVHLVACIWHCISYRLEIYGWVQAYGFEGLSLFYIYQLSFYWAAMTMTTVGYGDITPKNQYEYICANITMLAACIVFGYTMNRIGLLLININMRKADFKYIFINKRNNLVSLNLYMSKFNVTNQLQSRIRSYLDYRWEIENEFKNEQVQILVDKLPQSMSQELNHEIKGKVIESCLIFQKFSNDLKKKICLIADSIQFLPNEVVMDPQKQDESSLLIIQRGQLQIQDNTNKSVSLQFGPGKIIGEISFFTDQPRTLRIVSREFTTCYKINRLNFLSLLQDFSKDKELFHYIKDSIQFNKQYQKLNLNCLCCYSDSHMLSDCPLLALCVDKDMIIKRFIFPFKQKRNMDTYHERHRREKYSALKKQFDTQAMAHLFQDGQLQDSSVSILEEENHKSLNSQSKQLESGENSIETLEGYGPQVVNYKPSILKQQFSKTDQNTLQLDSNQNKNYEKLQFLQFLVTPDSDMEQVRKRSKSEMKPRIQENNSENKQTRVKPQFQNIILGSPSSARKSKMITNNNYLKIRYSMKPQRISLNPTGAQNGLTNQALNQYSLCKIQSEGQIKMKTLEEINLFDQRNKNFDLIMLELDRVQEFTNYFPNNNLKAVLKRLESQSQFKVLQSKYTFRYAVIKKVNKIKRILEKRYIQSNQTQLTQRNFL